MDRRFRPADVRRRSRQPYISLTPDLFVGRATQVSPLIVLTSFEGRQRNTLICWDDPRTSGDFAEGWRN